MGDLRFLNIVAHPALRAAGAVLLAVTFVPPARSQDRDPAPALAQQFGSWAVYTGTIGGRKVCFAMARPARAETTPPNRPRDPVYFFVTSRPADNVRREVSIILGYPHKSGSDATVEVGSTTLSLQTQSDNAWGRSVADDQRVVEAMRGGSDMVVKGTSARGTQSTDRYTLRGLSQSLDRLDQECR